MLKSLFGSKSKVKSKSILSRSQRQVEGKIGGHLIGKVGQGATPYSGQLVSDIPALFQQAYGQLGAQHGQYGDVARQALMHDVSGTPAYQWNEADTAKRWQRDFAVPAMETWQRTIAPMVKEQYAGVPGGFYSRDRAQGMSRAAGDYMGQYVQPSLFQAQEADVQRGFASGEAAAARRAPAAGQMAQLPFQQFAGYAGAADIYKQYMQQPLSAAYQEFQRMSPEQDPWTKLALDYIGKPTMQIVGQQGQEGILGGLLGTAGTMAMGQHFGLWGAGAGAAGGGAALAGMGAGTGSALGAFGGSQAGIMAAMAMSDQRVKHDISTIDSAVDKVKKLHGYTFRYNEQPDTKRAGVMAQDVEMVLPEAVFEVDGTKMVDYNAVVGLLVEAVAEMAEKKG